MADTQLMKGILEGCTLALIAEGETYGYQILSDMAAHGFTDVLEGTLYPILTRLERNGLIQCRKAKSPLGPVRKYYSITEHGSEYLREFRKNYTYVTACADSILNGKDIDGST
ncbi:MAG: PadR family transcriptional regulator [Lachnospiraceae bacterium]|nr:PadR family transcriptional regulator [Lachnospiraceae bacterium]